MRNSEYQQEIWLIIIQPVEQFIPILCRLLTDNYIHWSISIFPDTGYFSQTNS